MQNFSFVLVLCVIICVQDVTSQLTLAKLAKKMTTQGRKLGNFNREIGKLETLVHGLTGKVNQIKADMANMGVESSLDDLAACPNGIAGFYHEPTLGSCYRLEDISLLVNASQAESLCQGYSPLGHLVSIESEEEQVFLKSIWQSKYGYSSISRYWTSGALVSGNWQWTNSEGSEEIKYENWIPTTDHNDARFACLAVHSTEAYWWVDVACWSLHAVTCEITVPA